ncbi:MAG TPA: roadblock/LC7 domain-containing protein [Polyangia bacterium]|nr:roadblock/LC7 domain-containing protein [Polyangia bacterium]
MTGVEARALSETVRGSLATLKDVAGITGSFVCSKDGRLVAREIPALFEDAVLSEAGSRLLRVGETFAAHGDDIETAVVRFGDHRLYLKAIGGGLLCIVVAGPVNMPALRMAANLVSRRIAPAIAQVELEAPPPAPADGAVTAPIHAPGAARSQGIPGMRRFRGRTVE